MANGADSSFSGYRSGQKTGWEHEPWEDGVITYSQSVLWCHSIGYKSGCYETDPQCPFFHILHSWCLSWVSFKLCCISLLVTVLFIPRLWLGNSFIVFCINTFSVQKCIYSMTDQAYSLRSFPPENKSQSVFSKQSCSQTWYCFLRTHLYCSDRRFCSADVRFISWVRS